MAGAAIVTGTVTSVAPGDMSTPINGRHEADPATQPRPGVSPRRPGHAREVAHWAAPDARCATRASFGVDGGLLMAAANRS